MKWTWNEKQENTLEQLHILKKEKETHGLMVNYECKISIPPLSLHI